MPRGCIHISLLVLPLQLFQHPGEFLRQRTGEGDLFPRGRVNELQGRGVEALARQPRHRLFGPVHGVPQDGVADIGQVYSDLVGAARFQAAAQMGDAPIAGDDNRILQLQSEPYPFLQVTCDKNEWLYLFRI